MRYMRKLHPDLDILVSSIGEVFVPATKGHPSHWTFGLKRRDGYRQVRIDGKTYLVHRLVAQTFIQNPENKPQVDHINRQKDQNSVDNIRWATSSENNRNMPPNDRVDARGGTHYYEDAKKAGREADARYYTKNRDKVRERHARYYTKNRDKVRGQHARYYTENRDKVRELNARHYAENKDKILERHAHYEQAKCKTHKRVRFSDGSRHWLPLPEAEAYLIIPLKERNYAK